MALFQTQEVNVEALRVRRTTAVELARGTMTADVGDWLVTFRADDGLQAQYIFTDAEFRALFEPVEDVQSRRAWAEQFPHEVSDG